LFCCCGNSSPVASCPATLGGYANARDVTLVTLALRWSGKRYRGSDDPVPRILLFFYFPYLLIILSSMLDKYFTSVCRYLNMAVLLVGINYILD